MSDSHTPPRNWAGNLAYAAAALHHPTTVAEVQALVAGAHRVKALGSRHSFNAIADTTGTLVALDRLARVMDVDVARRTVTIDGGVRYGELCRTLGQAGWALHNLASLPHISVAGACATATHGSGDVNANLASVVAGMEIVTASGDVLALSRDHDAEALRAAAVSLGALGVVTRLTLDVEPAYDVRQDVYEGLPLAHVDAHLDEITGSAYSVSLFTDWREARFTQLWLKRRVGAAVRAEGGAPAAELFGARLATEDRHPIAGFPAGSCTAQLGVPGAWHDRLPHFRLEHTPSAGDELQTDYLVPREHARAALRAVAALRGRIAPLLQVCEVRTVAADDLWMSPCYRQPCVSIHFTWKPDWPAVSTLLPAIEGALAPLDARPHWGKLFTVPPVRVRSLYARLPEFRELVAQHDPRGKFRNAFLDAYLFGE